MRCPACGGELLEGKRFCADCGLPLVARCASCGAELLPGKSFCADCGAAVRHPPIPTSTTPPAAQEQWAEGVAHSPVSQDREVRLQGSTTELRRVSVLFCDLVGFTRRSEELDPDEVRELLSGYFDLSRSIISRYGGVVQKFIGDAVMAVWGAPVANEDDADRAVRAGLELVSAVANYGNEHAGVGLQARVGIVTGMVATTETPEEGLVVGDRVNTASRIQAAAPPGHCYVDESTRRATDASIVYADAGVHELKGKSEPVQLFEALRVVAGVGGALRSEGLEAPFVGRDRELRLVKDLFHASAEDSRAHLVSVTGLAGIGKSRLAWEFYKYMDGLSNLFRWHRGRCLSYGEGVAYWALAEMVRGRADILEVEDASSAAAKLHASVVEHISDPAEQKWAEPRLAHLIGLEERTARDKEDLFAAWRLFFERMSEQVPVVMSFEDMQWADASLLDFIEYLLDWSKNHSIFVLTLARPELVERRPNWGAGRRNFTSIYLEPLSEKTMHDLITGLVPGLPEEITDQILERAEGIPLYAVETVRMLIDRGLLVREGSSYQPVGAIGPLDVPETLQALISARLDGLSPNERGLLQDAAVLGKSFSKESLLSLAALTEAGLDELLASLVRKEILGLQNDPRSPERGQFAFLQDLVRAVVYETLPRRHRKEKHLAVATYLQDEWGNEDEEIIELIASHLLEAYQLAPDADDAAEVKSKARDKLIRAGERSASLAAAEEARRYFEQALSLADDAGTRATLEERAGQMASWAGQYDVARSYFERAIATFDVSGRTHASARVSARLGEIDYFEERHEEAVERMERAFAVLSSEETDADVAALAAQLGRILYFMGEHDRALSRIEFALDLAERLDLREQLSQALNTKAVILSAQGRKQEGGALLDRALKIALDHGLSDAALRAYNNVITFLEYEDRYAEALSLSSAGLELARRTGSKNWETPLLATTLIPMYLAGRWDELLVRVVEVGQLAGGFEIVIAALVRVHQGHVNRARELIDAVSSQAESPDLQIRSLYWSCAAEVLDAEGAIELALASAENAIAAAESLGTVRFVGFKLGVVEAFESALALGNTGKANELLKRIESLRDGETTAFLLAQSDRFRAKLDASERGDRADRLFGDAESKFRGIEAHFYLAVTLLEHAEWLVAHSHPIEAVPLMTEAAEIFERLQAQPWRERVDRAIRASRDPAVGGIPS
jgi:class 3 adenylate cyclase/tetratricopeptide (TPR) repeat protein